LSIQPIASTSLVFPKHLWVIDSFECRDWPFDAISSGVPDQDAYGAAAQAGY